MMSPDADHFIFDWSYPAALIWGFLILGSFGGWGWAMGRWLTPDSQVNAHWGVSAVRGLAIYLVLSGPMIMLSIFSSCFLLVFLSIGWLFLLGKLRLASKTRKIWHGPPTLSLRIFFVVLTCLIALGYAGAVATHIYNPYDDFEAYFAITKMLLDTGTFFDPFSFRLLGALGGQTALDSLIVVVLPWKYIQTMDMGVALLIVMALAQEIITGNGKKAWIARILLLGLILTFPVPRANTASECTGIALYMALFQTLHLMAKGEIRGWRAALLLATVITALATLRAPNIFVVAILGSSIVAWRLWKETQRREIIVEMFQTMAIVLVFIVPWWIVAYRSGGAFLYPLVRGTHRPEFETFSSHLSVLGTFEFIGLFLISYYYLPLFFPVYALMRGLDRQFLRLVGGVLFIISLMMMAQLTFALPRDINRYLVPMGAAFAFYTAAWVGRQLVLSPPETRTYYFGLSRERTVVLVAECVLFLQGLTFAVVTIANVLKIDWVIDSRHELSSLTTGPLSTKNAEANYPKAFAHIPPGKSVLIALDYPFCLDYRAHRIFNVDVAGGASPDPGLPYFHGAEAVKQYLLSKGIRYIAHVPFERAKGLHSREVQENNLIQPIVAYRYYATFELDFYNNVDQLAKTNAILYDSPDVRVIELNDK